MESPESLGRRPIKKRNRLNISKGPFTKEAVLLRKKNKKTLRLYKKKWGVSRDSLETIRRGKSFLKEWAMFLRREKGEN